MPVSHPFSLPTTLATIAAFTHAFVTPLPALGDTGASTSSNTAKKPTAAAADKPASAAVGASVPVHDVSCTLVGGELSSQGTTYAIQARLPLGPKPKLVKLPDAATAGKTRENPAPEDADAFLRGASGLRLLAPKDVGAGRGVGSSASGANGEGDNDAPVRLAVAQDSRRKLGVVELPLSIGDLFARPGNLSKANAFVSGVAVDTPENIAADEDDKVDYSSARKKKKRDFEAMATLPWGGHVMVGSGGDAGKLRDGKKSYRGNVVLVDESGAKPITRDAAGFFLSLQGRTEIVGEANASGEAEINIEGLTLRREAGGRLVAAFFHRGNANGNGHDSVVEYDALAWLAFLRTGTDAQLLSASYWNGLSPLRVVRFAMPKVKSLDAEGKIFPVTLNDAIEARAAGSARTVLIPVSTEAEFIDAKGNHQDGIVTFAGFARWDDDGAGGRCRIYRAAGDARPGEPSRYGKIEGLAAWRPGRHSPLEKSVLTRESLLLGVTDADSEITPSILSALDVKSLLD